MNPTLKTHAHRLVAFTAACTAAFLMIQAPCGGAVPRHPHAGAIVAPMASPETLVDAPTDFDVPQPIVAPVAPMVDPSSRFTRFESMPQRLSLAFGPTLDGMPVTVRSADALRVSEERLQALAPTLNPEALHLAMRAMACAAKHYGDKDRLVVIDYSLPSTARRLWVFDLRNGTLLWNEYVLHGRGSGTGLYARSFSNSPDSNQSSLGLFELQTPFQSQFGPAMSMVGLEHGLNDNAVERGIWLHGTDYVNDERAATGHVSQSEGCAAVQRGVIVPMINSLKKGAYLFSYYNDKKWQQASGFLSGKLC
ncbi:L,D-transpeptidase catalytic domain [Paraburkholderia phenazinium]|uniref:L,D-transpeptidase catalytic domain n=1 Tax=Paraburkholderia phenazinium TaxID=60549 RepID=A0A1G7YJM2_9BURK|nr:murein L,D-transpeptidase catalytic domain family protein [Paraburkholderia phenazinium]SDG96768.1 L,D-transpeptidase catalytic domain [Paraburkholderia phenazinium]